jgi:hypothetical protein
MSRAPPRPILARSMGMESENGTHNVLYRTSPGILGRRRSFRSPGRPRAATCLRKLKYVLSS